MSTGNGDAMSTEGRIRELCETVIAVPDEGPEREAAIAALRDALAKHLRTTVAPSERTSAVYRHGRRRRTRRATCYSRLPDVIRSSISGTVSRVWQSALA
jgi:hypothetical protein